MKYTSKLLYGLTLAFTLFSCEDFLEKPPSIDVTEETIFSTVNQTETFVANMYKDAMPNGYSYRWWPEGFRLYTILAATTDEGDMADGWYHSNRHNLGTISAQNYWEEEDDIRIHFRAIRKTNILLEKIESVPDASQEYKNTVKGEALFLRALNYSEMAKRYGGLPLLDKRLSAADEIAIPRSSYAETIDFILKDCDEATSLLPVAQPSHLRGRATKGAALALKSRTLLFAASPLFNKPTNLKDYWEDESGEGSAAPHPDFDVKLVRYENYDPARWQKAADAAKALLDFAATAGIRLITEQGPNQNYEYAWSQPDNAEIILANKGEGTFWPWDQAIATINPQSIYGGWGSGVSVPLNFVKHYEKKDGNPQEWAAAGDNLNQIYAGLDPRFGQTIAYNGSVWNNEIGTIELFEGGKHEAGTSRGHRLHKLVPRSMTWGNPAVANWIIFRLAETYLSYAEALNEVQGPTPEAYAALNAVRARSGMPPVANLSQEQFRERVRNERTVELAYEEHRFFDVRRWRIAHQEGVMKGKMYGIKITKIPGSSDFHYEQFLIEERVWNDKMYLAPFLLEEVLKGYLVQNPGW